MSTELSQAERFGRWLRRELQRQEMNESDLARKLNRPPSMVNRWASGKRVPSPGSCDLIADALSLDLDLVLWHAGHRPNLDVIDPDDPATTIISLAKRVDWSKPERFNLVEGIMRQWINIDHGEKMAARKDKE